MGLCSVPVIIKVVGMNYLG